MREFSFIWNILNNFIYLVANNPHASLLILLCCLCEKKKKKVTYYFWTGRKSTYRHFHQFSSVFCIADYGLLHYLSFFHKCLLSTFFPDKSAPKWHVKTQITVVGCFTCCLTISSWTIPSFQVLVLGQNKLQSGPDFMLMSFS